MSTTSTSVCNLVNTDKLEAGIGVTAGKTVIYA